MELDCDSTNPHIQMIERKRKRKRITTTQTNSSSWENIVKHVWLKEAKDKNFVFSPFSVYSTLSLLASGSDGQTLEQLLGFLKRKNLNDLNTYVSEIFNSLGSVTTGKANRVRDGPTLSFIGGVWVDSSCTLKPSFKETATSIYRAKAEAVNFKTQAKEVTIKVNKWAEKNTKGLIKNLLPEEAFDEDTKIVLANALYFRGSWEKRQFDPSDTEEKNFYILNGTSVKVPFMTGYGEKYVSCFDSFKVLKLPYKQATNCQKQLLSMYIFLPNERDGLVDLIEKVGSETGFLECHLPQTKVKMGGFWVPKFKISFDIELSRVLKDDLGLDLSFDPVKADLSKMLDNPSMKNLFVSKAIHKCFVEVDEKGTKAAAITSSVLSLRACRKKPVPRVNFVADHPFLFIIRDDVNRVVLFMGHVLNPSSH